MTATESAEGPSNSPHPPCGNSACLHPEVLAELTEEPQTENYTRSPDCMQRDSPVEVSEGAKPPSPTAILRPSLAVAWPRVSTSRLWHQEELDSGLPLPLGPWRGVPFQRSFPMVQVRVKSNF